MSNKKFFKGQIVQSGTTIILVTGKGQENLGYNTFAGTVLSDKEDEDGHKAWGIGHHSQTWNTRPFNLVAIDFSKVIENTFYK